MVSGHFFSRGHATSTYSAMYLKAWLRPLPPLSRAMPEKCRPLTPDEVEKTRELLLNSCQVWEVSIHIERSESAVQLALKKDNELASLLKQFKTARWTALEDRFLLTILAKNLATNNKEIAEKMGRKVESVGSRSRRLTSLLRVWSDQHCRSGRMCMMVL